VNKYKNWLAEEKKHLYSLKPFVVLKLNRPGENTLSEAALTELEVSIRKDYSGKVGGFVIVLENCLGADVKEIQAHQLAPDRGLAKNEVISLLERAHDFVQYLEKLLVPTVAAISGHCLGGGLELAMMCQARVLADTAKTRVGLPETKLGLIPGFGGTQTMPRLIPLEKALELISEGKIIGAAEALELGLADRLVKPENLVEKAVDLASMLRTGEVRPRAKRYRHTSWRKIPLVGRFAISFFTKKTVAANESSAAYPAAGKAVQAILASRSFPYGLEKERELFVDRLFSEESPNHIKVFFAEKELKKRNWFPEIYASVPKTVGVVGAGVMGRAIAYSIVSAGIPVVLYDNYPSSLHAGISWIENMFKKAVYKGIMSEKDAWQRRGLLTHANGLQGFAKCDFVIEAVKENLSIKRDLFGQLEKVVSKDAALMTNTSSILPSKIADGLSCPERFGAMHFFNPVEKISLVEVAGHAGTVNLYKAMAVELARKIGKVPVALEKECPELLVNRVLIPGLIASFTRAKEKGIHPMLIDRKFKNRGMLSGPFETGDLVGWDVMLDILKEISCNHPDYPSEKDLAKIMDSKRLGKKTGVGFYHWQGDRRGNFNDSILDTYHTGFISEGGSVRSFADVMRRSLYKGDKNTCGVVSSIVDEASDKMADEAVKIMEEGVCLDPKVINLAMILGCGCAPNRGGVFGLSPKYCGTSFNTL